MMSTTRQGKTPDLTCCDPTCDLLWPDVWPVVILCVILQWWWPCLPCFGWRGRRGPSVPWGWLSSFEYRHPQPAGWRHTGTRPWGWGRQLSSGWPRIPPLGPPPRPECESWPLGLQREDVMFYHVSTVHIQWFIIIFWIFFIVMINMSIWLP